MPIPANGLRVNAFATGLDHPRWLHVLPNGDVPVAETNAPAKHDEGFSFKKVGDDLVPDYMTSVRDGAFYGWP